MANPRILAWTAGFWRDADHAQRDADNWQGYANWAERVRRCFKPIDVFVASGSWSSPEFNPIPGGITVNAGVNWNHEFIYNRVNYSCMAVTAAMAYALNRVKDWDYLVLLETDALIGALNIPALLSEFASRPQTVMACSWGGTLGGPLIIWKPEGAIRFLHHWPYKSFCDPDEPAMDELPEKQWEIVCRGSKHWWNPWSHYGDLTHGWSATSNPNVLNWPVLSRPGTPEIATAYIQHHMRGCITL